MSLTRPVLVQMPSFDATKDQEFRFNVEVSSSQIVANKLTIRSQKNNSIVYEARQDTFKFSHSLPANTLTNGEYYNCVVTVFDSRGVESAPSLPIQFRCYTTPTLVFTNIPETGTINNSSYTFTFEYNQLEGERLSSYIVNLYDVSGRLMSTSGDIYVANGVPPYSSTYLFTQFVDDTAYYIEIIAQTINGASVSTGKILFNVDYKQPDLFTLLELENNCDGGYITVASNIILIDGVANPDPPKFINGKEIDLTEDGSYVNWPNGYTINDDFLARLWFRSPNAYSNILTFGTADGKTIQIDFMKGYESVNDQEMKVYVQVTVTSISDMEYFIISNYMTPLQKSEYYTLQFMRSKNLYQVELKAVKEAL